MLAALGVGTRPQQYTLLLVVTPQVFHIPLSWRKLSAVAETARALAADGSSVLGAVGSSPQPAAAKSTTEAAASRRRGEVTGKPAAMESTLFE